MNRTEALCLQFCVGVWCAYGIFHFLSEGATLLAAVNALGVSLTAKWKIPPKEGKQ